MARRGDGIYQRGKTWWLDFTHDGKRHAVRIGKGISRTVAGEIARVKRGEILKGEAGIGGGSTITLNTYADRWLKQVAGNLAPATFANYTAMLVRHIRPTLGDTRLHRLDRSSIKALLTAKRAQGLSKGTVKVIRATLSVILADALDDGLLMANPAQGLTRRGRKGPDTVTQTDREEKIRPMSVEQLETFLDAAQGRQGAWTLFLLLADAGLRPGEALALCWEDFDAIDQTVLVARAVAKGEIRAPKTATSRSVEITPRLVEALDRWQTECEKEALTVGGEPSPWMFAGSDGRPLQLRGLQGRFLRVLRRTKLPHFRLYDLRHTYASHALAAGAPITYVAKQLGHAKPTMTLRHYAHWIPTSERVWAARLENSRGIPNGIHNTSSAAQRASLQMPVAAA